MTLLWGKRAFIFTRATGLKAGIKTPREVGGIWLAAANTLMKGESMNPIFKKFANLRMRSDKQRSESGNTTLGIIIVVMGVAAVMMQNTYQSIFQDVKQKGQQMAHDTATQLNLSAVKKLENLMQPLSTDKTVYVSDMVPDHLKIMPPVFPHPYSIPLPPPGGFAPGQLMEPLPPSPKFVEPANFQRNNDGTFNVVVDLNTQSSNGAASTMPVSVKITPTGPRYDYADIPLLITGLDVIASSTEVNPDGTPKKDAGGKAITVDTRARLALPPPPLPTCQVIFDSPNAVYGPNKSVTGTVTVGGVASKVYVPFIDKGDCLATSVNGQCSEYATIMVDPWSDSSGADITSLVNVQRKRDIVPVFARTQSIDAAYDSVVAFDFPAPRPLGVVDAGGVVTKSLYVWVQGLNGDTAVCHGDYKVSLPPACGIQSNSYVLAPGACLSTTSGTLNLSSLPAGLNPWFTGEVDTSIGPPFKYNDNVLQSQGKFCMPLSAADGEVFTLNASVWSADHSEPGQCMAKFVADVTTDPHHQPKCQALAGHQALPYTWWVVCPPDAYYVPQCQNTFSVQNTLDVTNPAWVQVDVLANSQTNSWDCPDSSACFASALGGRNAFVELSDALTSACQVNGINRITLGCFAETTRIAVDKESSKLVKELKVGDQVWNPLTKKEATITNVSIGPEQLPMLVIKTDDRQLEVTTEHPMPTQRGLVMAQFLLVHDRIQYGDGSEHEVVAVRSVVESSAKKVRNFMINPDSSHAEDHMVLADGIVTGDLYLQNQLKEQLEKLVLK